MLQNSSFDSLIDRRVSESPVQFVHFTTRSPVALQVNPNDKLELAVYRRLMIALQLSVLTTETQESFRYTTGGHITEESLKSDVRFDVRFICR